MTDEPYGFSPNRNSWLRLSVHVSAWVKEEIEVRWKETNVQFTLVKDDGELSYPAKIGSNHLIEVYGKSSDPVKAAKELIDRIIRSAISDGQASRGVFVGSSHLIRWFVPPEVHHAEDYSDNYKYYARFCFLRPDEVSETENQEVKHD